ncbi:hypothetical protein LCGC14_1941380 [marine sediment metagenome]|uniref:Uncharacterized protein n=1 Tax=marine sediment metagenome TaxID=412755 RepID=A0A0F9G8S7_9ZZZZ
MRKRRRVRNKIQEHHLSYDPEITTKIYSGEHYAITMLNRRTKNVSKGFIECIKVWIEKAEKVAVDLDV